jgi:hypothetical protein|nr:MAG TPA: hypothetical protein [Caudoviricetes sp.]
MYSHQDKDRFAIMIVLISTVPFAILTTIAIVAAFLAAFQGD